RVALRAPQGFAPAGGRERIHQKVGPNEAIKRGQIKLTESPNLVYDGENRMVADFTAGATYVYDGNGTRVQKCLPNCTSPTSSTVFIFAGSQDIAEYNNGAAPASPSSEFIYSDAVPGSGLLATITGGSSPTTTYFHDDQLGWRISTDGTSGSPTYGQVIGYQGHYPFGESWYSDNGNEFVLTSYQRDAESGLDYAMARYYDSTAARFCSADPLGGQLDDPQTWNRYTYVRNDPINLTDPSGKSLLSWLVDALLVLADVLSGGVTTPESVEWGTAIQGAQDLVTIAAVQHLGEQTSPQGQKQPPPLPPPPLGQPSTTPTWKNCVSYNDARIEHSLKYNQLDKNVKPGEGTAIAHGPVNSDSAAVSPKQFGMSKGMMSSLRRQGKGITGTVYNDDGTSIDFSVDDRIADAKNPQGAVGKIIQANKDNQTLIELEGIPYKDAQGHKLPDMRRTIDLQGWMVKCPPGTR
ncbi:MAG: RHS repeat-associated core domain-containing protein, partial [Candidatus Acidiferrum sp.]